MKDAANDVPFACHVDRSDFHVLAGVRKARNKASFDSHFCRWIPCLQSRTRGASSSSSSSFFTSDFFLADPWPWIQHLLDSAESGKGEMVFFHTLQQAMARRSTTCVCFLAIRSRLKHLRAKVSTGISFSHLEGLVVLAIHIHRSTILCTARKMNRRSTELGYCAS